MTFFHTTHEQFLDNISSYLRANKPMNFTACYVLLYVNDMVLELLPSHKITSFT